MTKLETFAKLLTPLLLCVGIASAGPDPSNKKDVSPPPGDPRTLWNAHLEDCKKESHVWITNRSIYSNGPFDYEGRSLLYQNGKLAKLRYYFILAQGQTRWLEVSQAYQNQGTLTHGLEYDLDSGRWQTFDPSAPYNEPAEPGYPFALHPARGQAHPLLTEIARWECDQGLFFDGQHHTDVHTFAKDHVLRREIIRDRDNDKSAPFTRFRGREYHRAWDGILQLGDFTQTYAIDPKHKAMMFSTLVNAGHHTWFWGHRWLSHVQERLYEFDRSPFDSLTGMVTVTIREGYPDMGDPIEQRQETVEFKTTKTRSEGDNPDTRWLIEIPSKPTEKLTRIVWENGPDFFARTDAIRFDVWQGKDK